MTTEIKEVGQRKERHWNQHVASVTKGQSANQSLSDKQVLGVADYKRVSCGDEGFDSNCNKRS